MAFVDGGPATLEHDDGAIALGFDTRDGGGQLLRYALVGRMDGDELKGALTPPLDAPQGSWRAVTTRAAATGSHRGPSISRASGRARRRAWRA